MIEFGFFLRLKIMRATVIPALAEFAGAAGATRQVFAEQVDRIESRLVFLFAFGQRALRILVEQNLGTEQVKRGHLDGKLGAIVAAAKN